MKRAIDLQRIGEKIEFNDARERTNGQRSECLVTLQPGKKGPPPHIHIQQVEVFEVLIGRMLAVVNGKETTANVGETVVVQPGETHTFRNGSDTEPLVMKVYFEKALNIEWMLQTMGEEAMRKGGDWDKISAPLMMYIFFKMRREYRLAGIPFWLQDAIFGIGAAIAGLTGSAKKVQMPTDLA